MDIGIIITLLIFLLSIAGPVIEKQLKKAGKVEQARTLRKITGTISGDGRDEMPETSSAEVPESSEVQAEPSVPPVPEPRASEVRPAADSGQAGGNFPDARAEAWSKALERYIARNKSKAAGSGDVSLTKTGTRIQVKTEAAPAEKKKLDIDPRKLVIYSEIMKPKF